MDTNEDESPLFQNREREEIILSAVDMLCILGASVGIVMGVEHGYSLPMHCGSL